MNIGDNLKRARKAAGLTQQQLAVALGVYQKDISRWESGGRKPSAETFGKICRITGASADELLGLPMSHQA